jgi:hypothetical protein
MVQQARVYRRPKRPCPSRRHGPRGEYAALEGAEKPSPRPEEVHRLLLHRSLEARWTGQTRLGSVPLGGCQVSACTSTEHLLTIGLAFVIIADSCE